MLVLLFPTITGCFVPYRYKVASFAGEGEHDLNGVKLNFHFGAELYDRCSGSSGPPFQLVLNFIGKEIHKSLTIDSLVVTLSDNNQVVMQLTNKITKSFDNAYIDDNGSRLEGIVFPEKMDFKYDENSRLMLTATLFIEMQSGETYRDFIVEIFTPYYINKWLLGGLPLC